MSILSNKLLLSICNNAGAFLLPTHGSNEDLLKPLRREKIMADTLNETMEIGTDSENQAKTFTQEEVNAIVEGRLKKESAKYSDYAELKAKAEKLSQIEDANKSELQKAIERADSLQKQIDDMNHANEVRSVREKVAKDVGVPYELLRGNTEEECMEQAQGILNFRNNSLKYPTVKDGGEVLEVGKLTPEQEFGEWLKKTL